MNLKHRTTAHEDNAIADIRYAVNALLEEASQAPTLDELQGRMYTITVLIQASRDISSGVYLHEIQTVGE
jgi:hypothetical protein